MIEAITDRGEEMFSRVMRCAMRKYSQKGQGFVEYALVIAFVVAIAVLLTVVRPDLMDAVRASFDRPTAVIDSV